MLIGIAVQRMNGCAVSRICRACVLVVYEYGVIRGPRVHSYCLVTVKYMCIRVYIIMCVGVGIMINV